MWYLQSVDLVVQVDPDQDGMHGYHTLAEEVERFVAVYTSI